MKVKFLILLLSGLRIGSMAQETISFKVRAPLTTCKIRCDQPEFFLELDNEISLELNGKNRNVKVNVLGGRIVSSRDNTYFIRTVKPGVTTVSVYLISSSGSKLIAVRSFEVLNPPLFLYGVKMDSTSKRISMHGENFYAYSKYYRKKMPVTAFQMYFVADTTKKTGTDAKPLIMKSDTCMLTGQMRALVMSYQPNYNYIYFANIVCRVPDGTKRILDPIELKVIRDTADREHLSLIYSLHRKKI